MSHGFQRAILVITLILMLANAANAGGEKYQITFLLSPSVEWVYFRASQTADVYNDIFGPKLSYNFGAEYKHFFDPSLSISTGVLYQNKGFRNKYDVAQPDGSTEEQTTLGSVHMASIPIYLNAHHNITRKTEMIYTAGLGFGYVLSQTIRNRNYTGEEGVSEGLFEVGNGVSNINMFRDFYLGLHMGIGISTYIKSRVVMIVQPMYKYQLNDGRDPFFPNPDPFAAKLNSLAFDIKVGYFFNRQIQNRRKSV